MIILTKFHCKTLYSAPQKQQQMQAWRQKRASSVDLNHRVLHHLDHSYKKKYIFVIIVEHSKNWHD